jgi:hypothetical protein
MRGVAVAIAFGMGLCGAATAGAQPREVGVKAGVTLPAVVFDPEEEGLGYGRRVGAAFGGFLVLPMNERFAAQIEALFVAKGGKLTVESGQELVPDQRVTLKLDYFEVPLLGRVTLHRTARRAIYVFGGPSLGFRTNATAEDAISLNGYMVGNALDVGVDFKRLEAGVIVGAGVDIGEWVVIDGRYSWGLTDVNRNPDITSSIRTRVLAFMGGIRW